MALASLIPRSARQAAKSAALVACGVGSLGKKRFAGSGCILTFHGLRPGHGLGGINDGSLHLPAETFREICAQLHERHTVMPLAQMVARWQAGEPLPPDAVALTFDDGYATNFELALPILAEYAIPATVFLTTGFIDGEDMLWFQRADRALGDCSQAKIELTLARLKRLPDAAMRAEVAQLEKAAGLDVPSASEMPAVSRPLTWEQVRKMEDSGLVEIGAHTHTHPILARCDVSRQRQEICKSRDRIAAETGVRPALFAFPNGGPDDFDADTLALLEEAGFDAAFTMISGHLTAQSHRLQLPRYGSPESRWEAAATATGAFELMKEWRQRCRNALGGGGL